MVKNKEPDFKWSTEDVEVDLEKIRLDLNNVRFQHLSGKMPLTEEKMDELIWKEKTTKSLYNQIVAAQKLFEEPVLNSNYIVREGNRRIVCLRHIKQEMKDDKLPQIPKNTFDHIKCKIIPEGVPEDEVLVYLATAHIKGKLAWPAFNKAKQMYDLNSKYGYSYDEIRKTLGMGKNTVKKMIDAYNQTDRYGKKYPDDRGWYEKYTYFNELLTKRDLKVFSKLQENIDKFSKWVHEDKFKDSRNIRYLPQILANESAMRLFEKYGFNEAFNLIQEFNPELNSKEFKQIRKTIEILQGFSRKELIKTAKDPSRLQMIEKLKREADSLLKDLESLEKGKE